MKKRKRINGKCCNGHSLSKYGRYIGKNKDQLYCTECRRVSNREWHKRQDKKDPLWQIKKHLRLNWDMTLQDYDDLLESQGNVCAICGTEDFGKTRGAIDHCHKTGKIRGILCNNCNNGLGRFKDNIDFLKSAINYLMEDH